MTKFLRASLIIRTLFFLAVFVVFSVPITSHAKQQKLYTAYNIWLHRSYNMKFINFKGGREFIPAGTEVKYVKIGEEEVGNSVFVAFTRADNGKYYSLFFERRYHPHKSIEDYKQLTFTPETFEELTRDFTKNEIDAIRSGKVVDGMSKEAVLVSYGYPPEHRTKIQNDNTWTYWINKQKKRTIQFNDKGFTINTGSKVSSLAGTSTAGSNRQTTPASNAADVLERIKVLNKLLDQGLITPEEFSAKKQELINQL